MLNNSFTRHDELDPSANAPESRRSTHIPLRLS